MNRNITRFTRATPFQKITAAASALLFAGLASAQGLAGAVTAEVDSAELIAIGVAVLGLAGVVLMIKSGRRAAS